MKNLIIILAAISLVSCQKQSLILEESTADGIRLINPEDQGFDEIDFDFQLQPNLDQTYTVSVNMEDTGSYGYLWEVDGKAGGHEKEVVCPCGIDAKVKVINLDNGAGSIKKIELPSCKSEVQLRSIGTTPLPTGPSYVENK